MSDYEKLEKALSNGFFLIGPTYPLSKIQSSNDEYSRTGNQALSIESFAKVFHVQMEKRVLLDPSNKTKSLIIVKNPTSRRQIEILTSDKRTIERARQQLEYQNAPVGTLITAHCAVFGGSSNPEQILHLEEILPTLDGLLGWRFKRIGEAAFETTKRLDSIEEKESTENIIKLRRLLNYIAITRKIGLQFQRYAVSRIPRYGPFHGIWGSLEWMVDPLSKSEVDSIEKFISSTPEVLTLAEGLNQVYLLTSISSRLALLWALTETIFGDAAQHLLTEGEVATLLEVANNISTLKESPRLEKLRSILKNKDQVSLKGRNQRISENIAKALEWNFDEVYAEIKAASNVRGKYLHELQADDQRLKDAEKYLRTMLENHLERKMKES